MIRVSLSQRRLCLLMVLPIAFMALMRMGRAEQVQSIAEDCTMKLQNGQLVVLAGIRIAPEAKPSLLTLLGSKEVEVEYEPVLQPQLPSDIKPVYLYVKTSEVDFPFKTGEVRESRVMVNQLLLALGAARVNPSMSFPQKDEFLKAEATARERGEGIWSYQTA